MAKKYRNYTATCDHCGGTYKHRENYKKTWGPTRVERELNGFIVEVMTGRSGVWNNHNLCPNCIVNVLQNKTPKSNVYYSKGHEFVTNTVYMHEHEYMMRMLKGEQLEPLFPDMIFT